MAKKYKKRSSWQPPYPMRRGQLIAPFGIGSMVDFPRESLMVAGLDAWPDDCPTIQDERLSARLGVDSFRLPPAPPENPGDEGGYIPAVRFPQWHQCPRCHMLDRIPLTENRSPRCGFCRAEKRTVKIVPLRFVIACDAGHIDDFPWVEWAHRRGSQDLKDVTLCDKPQLKLWSSGRAGLDGLWLKCDGCGAPAKNLAGASRQSGLPGFSCRGCRPWLGAHARQKDCSRPVRMVQRGASNVYFGDVVSSILIPPYSSRYYDIVSNNSLWHMLTNGVPENDDPPMERITLVADAHQGIDPVRLLAIVRKKRTGQLKPGSGQSEGEFRLAEYKALSDSKPMRDDLFMATRIKKGQLHSSLTDYFDGLVRVERLAETRALVGLSRLVPPAGAVSSGTADQRNLSLASINWLPANRVYGEGIFFSLPKDSLTVWANIPAVVERTKKLADACNDVRGKRNQPSRQLLPKFFLVHTLAHALIRQLSFECGYGSSSLRERIYCDDGSLEDDMSGLLIYTAAGDCEGTLGGLVRQAEPKTFSKLVRDSIAAMRWCSSDPLCIEAESQGADGLNKAACHACVLLPETSCEEGNRLLDRALLVGTDEHPELGFFRDLVDVIVAGKPSKVAD